MDNSESALLDRSSRTRYGKIGWALIAISFALPLVLFGLAAWQSRAGAEREIRSRTEKTLQVLHEHASKVFETHRLVIDQVNERLRTIDWHDATQTRSLHELLNHIQEGLDQVATVTVTDSIGRMRASSRVYPAMPEVTFSDRDWFQALKANKLERPYVSRSYAGRQSGQAVFNVADRIVNPDGAFHGAIAVSVDRGYFERIYTSVEMDLAHDVTLFRDDGAILAREPAAVLTALPTGSKLMAAALGGASGVFERDSRIDGVVRISSVAKVAPYNVYVGFGIDKDSALSGWRRTLLTYGFIAGVSSLALLTISMLAIRKNRRERMATVRWREAAAAARAEMVSRNRAEEQLRQAQKMEAVGRLTGGVAHDFNNLLTVVIGSLDMLRRRLTQADHKELKLVENALEGANRAATLTHSLLAFSRQQPLEPKILDVNKLVLGLSEMLRRTLGENVAVETVLAGGAWQTLADPNQLESAILNLAVNSRDAMPSGGKLTLETANCHLDEAYVAHHQDLVPGQYVMVAVCDTGMGMAPDVAARAFEPFFTTKAIGKGTGLGLSQVYGFVKQSRGHAAIYTEVGHGSTFKIYLPRSRQAELHTMAFAAIEVTVPAANGETVLVVEDEGAVRRFSAEVLREAGYQVLEAEDGTQALAHIDSHKEIALLFTDVVLTGSQNGREIAEEACKRRPDLKVLFTTGYTRNAIIHHGRLDEGVHLLSKPFTMTELLTKVQTVLDVQSGERGKGSNAAIW